MRVIGCLIFGCVLGSMGAGLFKYGVGTDAGRNGRLVEESYYIERLVLERKQSSAWNWKGGELLVKGLQGETC